MEPWSPVDSLAVIKLIAFGFSFDLDIDRTLIAQAYRTVGAQAGFDGAAAVREDLFRFEPFTPASTVPDATGGPPRSAAPTALPALPVAAATATGAAAAEIPAAAFNGSTDQNAYRWGKLHRVTFTSPLGAPYTVPSPGNPVRSPLPGLAGIPIDGGLYTVDVANVSSRADNADGFGLRFAPARRLVAQAAPGGMRAETSLPGGVSEAPGDRWSGNLLGRYLTNDTYPVRLYPRDLVATVASVTLFVAARR